MKPIRVLYVNGGLMHRGGIESYMMNYYRNMDRDRVQFDFIVHGYDKGEYDDEIYALGGKIYHVPIKSKHPIKYKKELRKIFKNNNYKIIHSHLDAMSAWVLKEAKYCNIPIRIAHSHNTQHLTTNRIKFLINEQARKNINKYANYRCACSKDAAKWLFGTEDVTYIKNAIDLQKFEYNKNIRNKLRQQYGINDELVIGHIGRFDYQKNHQFMLNALKEITKTNSNAKLVLVGDGVLRAEIENQINDLELQNNVILLGIRDDVDKICNMFDCFVLPSRFEGLGIVLIEAQANGLKCFASNVVPTEANAGGNVVYLPFNEKIWAKSVLDADLTRNVRKDMLIANGYDIKMEANKLQQMYLDLAKGV